MPTWRCFVFFARIKLKFYLEIRDKITNLHFAAKHDRVLASAPFRLYFPPSFDRYMEWGFTDGSVRFFSEDRKKVPINTLY